MNKLELVAIAKDYINNSPYGTMDFLNQPLIVLPTVFPPDLNTPLLAEVVETLVNKVLEKNEQCHVLEMGTGSGAAILKIAQIPGVIATASDIAPMAVLNAKANALWWGVECDIYQGNLFENVPLKKFDIIFWNVPFSSHDPGNIEDVKLRIAFDPDYGCLKQFLIDVNKRLAEGGQILLAVDYDMADFDTICNLVEQAGFHSTVFKESQIMWNGIKWNLAFLLVNH
ncbi:MAG: methyltransferase [Nostoc sp.]|uniref:methyltransferase n=1 Tax=Nostoc sp. TaxID=1180 RepID=UPI002FFC6E6C